MNARFPPKQNNLRLRLLRSIVRIEAPSQRKRQIAWSIIQLYIFLIARWLNTQKKRRNKKRNRLTNGNSPGFWVAAIYTQYTPHLRLAKDGPQDPTSSQNNRGLFITTLLELPRVYIYISFFPFFGKRLAFGALRASSTQPP